MLSQQIVYKIYKSPLGEMVIAAEGGSIVALKFLGQRGFSRIPLDWICGDSPAITKTESQLTEYFSGNRKKFSIKYNLVGTDFQKLVWEVLSEIPFGATLSYGDIAYLIGRPKAVRAVGTAVGKNPICLIAPCHRVIRSDGALGEYVGGKMRKIKLLKLEQ